MTVPFAEAVTDRPRVIVVGLGPGGHGQLTDEVRQLLDGSRRVFLRTLRHPTASVAVGATSFDALYDQADELDDVYRAIAAQLAEAAAGDGEVIYAVPGSPLVLERSVRYLKQRADVAIDLRAAVSFLDLCWARLGIDPVEESVRLVDGHVFASAAAGERGPLLVAHTHASWVLSDVKLAVDAGPELKAIVLQGLGTDDEAIFEVPWPDLDRSFVPDHLTSLYLPAVAAPVAGELLRSVDLMHRLRAECPWDAEQDHASLRKHLLEETHEVLAVLDRLAEASGSSGRGEADPDHGDGPMAIIDDDLGALYAELEEELGDLWFQILFHAELAQEAGQFGIADVAEGLRDKLTSRHPHVFGAGTIDADSDESVGRTLELQWEQIKAEEKGRDSILDGIPPTLPALALAEKFLSKATRAGSGVDKGEAIAWLTELVSAVSAEDEVGGELVGRGLLGLLALLRSSGVDSEAELRAVTTRSMQSFRDGERDTADGAIAWVTG